MAGLDWAAEFCNGVQMIESARGAAPFDRGRRAALRGRPKKSNPFDQPQRQTQSGLSWERKCSEWDEGWEAGKAELQNTGNERAEGSAR